MLVARTVEVPEDQHHNEQRQDDGKKEKHVSVTQLYFVSDWWT